MIIFMTTMDSVLVINTNTKCQSRRTFPTCCLHHVLVSNQGYYTGNTFTIILGLTRSVMYEIPEVYR